MSTQNVINLTYLNEISKGDKNFIDEMIGIFLSETPDEIKELEKAINHADFEKIRAISHHLKSTVPFVGLDLVIGPELAKIEDFALNKKEIETISNHFKKVKEVFKMAHQELGV